MKERIQRIVIKYLLKWYFREKGFIKMSTGQILQGYLKMRDPDILNTLRHRMTNFNAENLVAKKGSEDLHKGRVLELLDLFREIEGAQENLLKLDKQEEKQRKTQDVLGNLKNKLAGFKKRKSE